MLHLFFNYVSQCVGKNREIFRLCGLICNIDKNATRVVLRTNIHVTFDEHNYFYLILNYFISKKIKLD